jgi:sulfite exporter TauE/SafE
MIKTAISFFILGVFFGSGPCLTSCGPLLVSYAAGTQKNIRSSLSAYALFSIARICVYVLLGMLIFFIGKFVTEVWLTRIARYVFFAGGCFVILLGVLTAWGTVLSSRTCRFLHSTLVRNDKKSMIALGVMLALAPCAPLLGLFGYWGLAAKTWAASAIYALVFGLGTSLSPLLAALALVGAIPAVLKNNRQLAYFFRLFCGLLMVALGIQLAWQGAR